MAQIAETQSKVILNLAKADEASDQVQIEALKVQIDGLLEQGRLRLEAGKAMDTREANERKSEIDGKKAANTSGTNG